MSPVDAHFKSFRGMENGIVYLARAGHGNRMIVVSCDACQNDARILSLTSLRGFDATYLT